MCCKRTQGRTHTWPPPHTLPHTRTPPPPPQPPHTRTRACRHARSHARARPHTHAHTHMRTHMRARSHTHTLLCISTMPLYSELVLPHALATLITITTFPAHSPIERTLPSASAASSSVKRALSVIFGFANVCPMRTGTCRTGGTGCQRLSRQRQKHAAANEETDSASKCSLAVSTPLPRALLTVPHTLALFLQLLLCRGQSLHDTHKGHVKWFY